MIFQDGSLHQILNIEETKGVASGVDDGEGVDSGFAHHGECLADEAAAFNAFSRAGTARSDGVLEVSLSDPIASEITIAVDADEYSVVIDDEAQSAAGAGQLGHRFKDRSRFLANRDLLIHPHQFIDHFELASEGTSGMETGEIDFGESF